MQDPEIERIEADLRESRFKPWDVETFLANRHQAKIEALTAPGDPKRRTRQAIKDLGFLMLAAVGCLAIGTLFVGTILSGKLPTIANLFQEPRIVQIQPIAPMLECPAAPTDVSG